MRDYIQTVADNAESRANNFRPEPLKTLDSNQTLALSVSTPINVEANHGLNRRRWYSLRIPKPHSRKILLACGLVAVPMIAFTMALLWIVFKYRVAQADCPFVELCPGPELLNTTNHADYYIDFPAARIAFLASLSSSISFSLVSVLMTIYAYSIARQLLSSSEANGDTDKLPSPYQTSLLIRVLSADPLAFWELICRKTNHIFWKREASIDGTDKRQSPWILRRSIIMFVSCMTGSILIQAADSYLHITAESVNFVRIQAYPQGNAPSLSRGLAPWCLNRDGVGSRNNKNFWSCGVQYDLNDHMISLSNSSAIFAVDDGVSKQDAVYSYTDEHGVDFAIVAPANMDPNVDWVGSTFGISTQCSSIPAGSCDIGEQVEVTDASNYRPFNCTKERSGIGLEGNMTALGTEYAYLNFHKYLSEYEPFTGRVWTGYDDDNPPSLNVTDEEVDDVFRNPWDWISIVRYAVDTEHFSEEYNKDGSIWKVRNQLDFVFLKCNTTVWDIEYSVVGQKVAAISKRRSNGTIAGISSVATSHSPNFFSPSFERAEHTANFIQTSPQTFISSWITAANRILALPLSSQSTPRPSPTVQTRVANVITRLPIAALWVLVAANLFYAFLGLGLAMAALRDSSDDVAQVCTRLGVAGLAAALFEREHSQQVAESDMDLFEENKGASEKRLKVGVRRTDTGGSAFALV